MSESALCVSAKRPLLFYVGGFGYPDGNAGAQRVNGVGEALRDAGFEVVFLGTETEGRLQDRSPTRGEFYFEGFRYHPTGIGGNTPLTRTRQLWLTHLGGASVISRLSSHWTPNSAVVVAYQASCVLLERLRRFCSRNNAVLLADVVEWYDRRHVTLGRFGPFALDSELRMHHMRRFAHGVLAISRLLEDHFVRQGLPTLRVPGIVDTRRSNWMSGSRTAFDSTETQLVFVGNAGRKELLANFIRGISLLNRDIERCRLTIVGPTHKQVVASLGEDASLLAQFPERYRIVGRVPHAEALHYLRRADFSVLLRPDIRSSHAGFPTKLTESLAMGVPVLCNLTGDIGLYVRDGQEAVVIENETPLAVVSAIRRAMRLSGAQRAQMSVYARQRAESSLDYRVWTQPLGEFVSRLVHIQRGRPR